jgi:hypothetical protein
MRTTTTTIYTAAELKEADGRAFEHALGRYRQDVYDDPAWASEHRDSLKAMVAAFGRGDVPEFDDVRRCMAWVENNILAPLRQPWLPLSHPKRRATSRYGGSYRPGYVKPCPFTGFYVDDDLLDYVRTGARKGDSPRDILRGLQAEADRLWESELEGQAMEEEFVDAANANGWEFDESGRMV